MLNAGHAENALPQKATATVNCRIFPGVSVEDVQKQLATVVADPKINIKVLGAPVVSPVSELRPDVERAIAKSIQKRQPGVPLSPYLESGGTDGMIYRTVGIPTWASSGVFIKPNEMFAHGLDERIPVKSFYDGHRAYPRSRGCARWQLACRRNQIVQAHVLAEVKPARRAEGQALDVEAFQAGIGHQLLHPLGRDELVEVVGALRVSRRCLPQA